MNRHFSVVRFYQTPAKNFNCGKMHDISLTSEEVLNSMVYGTSFCVIVYTSYKLSEMVGFLWLKLIGIFGVVWFL